MPRATPYDTTNAEFHWRDARLILDNLDHNRIVTEPLSSPRGGEIYVHRVANTKRGRINPLADGITWDCGSYMGVPKAAKKEDREYHVRRHTYRSSKLRRKKKPFRAETKCQTGTGEWREETDVITGKKKKICDTDIRFRRVVYEPVPAKDAEHFHIVVHYIGDESIVILRHHGNRKGPIPEGLAPYLRTAPETLGDLRSSTRPPMMEYSDRVERTNNTAIAPRDPKQVSNCQRLGRDCARISKDALWSAIWFSSEMARRGEVEFMRILTLRPALHCVLMDQTMVDEAREILRTCDKRGNLIFYDTIDWLNVTDKLCFVYMHNITGERLLLNADTMFKVGDFYVTTLVASNCRFCTKHVRYVDKDDDPDLRHPACPSIPIAFMIHERRHQWAYEDFITAVLRRAPFLRRAKTHRRPIAFVSDRDDAMQLAIALLTGWLIFSCWNHMRRNVRRKVSDTTDECLHSKMHSVGECLGQARVHGGIGGQYPQIFLS